MEESTANNDGPSTPKKKRLIRNDLGKGDKPVHRPQKYRKEWEQQLEFRGWLTASDNPLKAKCKVCNVLLSAEISTIRRHGSSNKDHIKNFKSIQKIAPMTSYITPPKISPLQISIKKAEIRIAAYVVEHNLPFNAVEHVPQLLKNCFPDSKIAQGLELKRTKCTKVVEKVLATEAKSNIVKQLCDTEFSILTDESTDITSNKQACVVVRYFDFQSGRIRSKFWALSDIFVDEKTRVEGATGENLFNNLMKCFEEYNIADKNIIGFGSDGCNVMMGEHDSVASRMRTRFPGITIMKCICHSFHLCASAACEVLPRRCEELTRNIVNYFNRSSKRLANLQQFQKLTDVEMHRLLHPSQTRWLSVHAAIKRILEQWPALLLYFESVRAKEKSISVDHICEDLKDVFVKLIFKFLCWVLPKVNDLNTYFQHEKVVLTDLDDKMRCTYRDLLVTYLDRNYVARTPLGDIDPKNKQIFVHWKCMYVGTDVLDLIATDEFKEAEKKSPNLLKDFYLLCQLFLSTLCFEIKTRYDFNNTFYQHISALGIKNALSDNFRTKYPSLHPLMNDLPRISISVDKQSVDDDWRKLPLTELPDEITQLRDPDIFWYQLLKLKNAGEENVFPSLPAFALKVLVLPHSNADCERIFSKINLVKVKLRNRLITNTVESCVLSSQLVSNHGHCHSFEITESMLNHMTTDNLYERKKNIREGTSSSSDNNIEENVDDPDDVDVVTFHGVDYII